MAIFWVLWLGKLLRSGWQWQLRTIQVPFITPNKRKSYSESSVMGSLGLSSSHYRASGQLIYTYTAQLSFSPPHQRGARSQGPPFSSTSLSFKPPCPTKSDPTEKVKPKTAAQPHVSQWSLTSLFRMMTVDPGS